jgi:hypothetical protein
VLAAVEERTRVVETDVAGRLDDARAELDGREVPIAPRPQAHHETRLGDAQAALLGVGDDGRVEQGSDFERELAGEVGTDEQRSVVGDVGAFPETVAVPWDVPREDFLTRAVRPT